jgi:hypothetical protein
MAEMRHEDGTPRRYEDTNHPRNPPNAVTNRNTRRAAVWSYFAPIVILFVVIGLGLIYWSSRPGHQPKAAEPRPEVGTFGSGEGGFDPATKPRTVRSEINRRGEDLAPLTGISDLWHGKGVQAGRQVDMQDVTVESAKDDTFWVREGNERILVLASNGAAAVKAGARVNVAGTVERDDAGTFVIRANRVDVK